MSESPQVSEPLSNKHLSSIKEWQGEILDLQARTDAKGAMSSHEKERLRSSVVRLRKFLKGIGLSESFQAYHAGVYGKLSEFMGAAGFDEYARAVLKGDRVGVKRKFKIISDFATQCYGIGRIGVYLGHLAQENSDTKSGELIYRKLLGRNYKIAAIYHDLPETDHSKMPRKRMRALLHELAHGAQDGVVSNEKLKKMFPIESEFFFLDGLLRVNGLLSNFKNELYYVMPTEVDSFASEAASDQIILRRVAEATLRVMPQSV